MSKLTGLFLQGEETIYLLFKISKSWSRIFKGSPLSQMLLWVYGMAAKNTYSLGPHHLSKAGVMDYSRRESEIKTGNHKYVLVELWLTFTFFAFDWRRHKDDMPEANYVKDRATIFKYSESAIKIWVGWQFYCLDNWRLNCFRFLCMVQNVG